MKRPVVFYSEGVELRGDIYVPDDLREGEKRAGIVLCHGYTGVKDLYLPDTARGLNGAGYVAMTFDYKGWGESEGPRSRLAPYSRVLDVQAAMTFLSLQPAVHADRIGLYGTSYGGATVCWVGAVDPRARCIVSVVGIGHGGRGRRVTTGESEFVERREILLPDRQSTALAAAARRDNPWAVNTIPLEYVDDTLGFHPEWIVDKIAPRPILFITTDNDRLVPPEESAHLYARAQEPKRLVVLKGYGHYEVYNEPAFSEVMAAALEWYHHYLPPR